LIRKTRKLLIERHVKIMKELCSNEEIDFMINWEYYSEMEPEFYSLNICIFNHPLVFY